MIECIFTVDYEIYGNGEGSLRELIYEPARKLQEIFDQHDFKLVLFVETVELNQIESAGVDLAIHDVKKQIQHYHQKGHEIALHLHPQWFKGQYINGKWHLDYDEYNLCQLSEQRATNIIDDSIKYLRTILSLPNFTPLSFRAGNWLFQPTQPVATILSQRGIKVDSSVFKGGLQHQQHLDYRSALTNGYFWPFRNDVNIPDNNGILLEVPIHSQMVFPWQMATAKRLGLQQSSQSGMKIIKQKVNRLRDFTRLRQPLKLDFCWMTIEELIRMMNLIIKDDLLSPSSFKPIVAIGHTKDLFDFETVKLFLNYLSKHGIKVSTFEDVHSRIINSFNYSHPIIAS